MFSIFLYHQIKCKYLARISTFQHTNNMVRANGDKNRGEKSEDPKDKPTLLQQGSVICMGVCQSLSSMHKLGILCAKRGEPPQRASEQLLQVPEAAGEEAGDAASSTRTRGGACAEPRDAGSTFLHHVAASTRSSSAPSPNSVLWEWPSHQGG